ncbi:MAG: putative restriction endonuclease [Rariglobus sp.]|nr:putative restriction endonuclease [Rariglobus sp.]
MSRDADHGGKGWGFSTCLWAPIKKENGAQWPFWSKVRQVLPGDVVLHLKGIPPNAHFTGFSVVASAGYKTESRPPILGQWAFSKEFFRSDLTDYMPFPMPISLKSIFSTRKEELSEYFIENKTRSVRKNIFYVIQSARLQCLNGAYLSELDEQLAGIILGSDFSEESEVRSQDVSVETAHVIRSVKARIGQKKFSDLIKSNYGSKCCFPGCDVTDADFLVGAHIARWADRIDLRGRADNGLCLCLMHDKAFEKGFFTIDENLNVKISEVQESGQWCMREVAPYVVNGFRLAVSLLHLTH